MGRKKKKKLQQAEAITASAEIKQPAPVETNQAAPVQSEPVPPGPVEVPPSTGPLAEPAPDTVSTEPTDGPQETYEEPPTITPSVAAEVEAENASAQTSEIYPEAPATEETTDVSQEAANYLNELKQRATEIDKELYDEGTPTENFEALETELAGIKAQIAELEDPDSI